MLIGVVTFFVTFVFALSQRQKKAISYQIVSNTALLSVSEEIKDKFQMTYQGRIVQQPHLVIVKIFNSGNVPIKSKDYEEPLIVHFEADPQLISIEIIESDPNDVKASFKVENSAIVIEPKLLNKADSIRIKALTGKPCSNPNVTGRIEGVKRIMEFTGLKQIYYYFIAGIGTGISLMGLLLGSQYPWSAPMTIGGGLLGLYGLSKLRV